MLELLCVSKSWMLKCNFVLNTVEHVTDANCLDYVTAIKVKI